MPRPAFIPTLALSTHARVRPALQARPRPTPSPPRPAALRQTAFLTHPSPAPTPRTASPPHAAPRAALGPPAILHTTLSLCAYLSTQRLSARVLALNAVSFPAPLAAMLVLLGLVLLARAVGADGAVDGAIATVFAPATALLTRWLAVFFVPNLVMLPLAAPLPSADVAVIAAVVLGGFFASLLSSVVVAVAIRKTLDAVAGKGAAIDVASNPGPPPPSAALVQGLGCATAALLAASVAAVKFRATGDAAAFAPRLYALVLTLFSFAVAQRFPKKLKTILHPLITCTASTIAGMALLGALTGAGFLPTLSTYLIRTGTSWGGGNVLAALLGPAVISFAFQIDSQRLLLRARFPEIVGTSLAASAFGLFGSAFAARALNASPAVRLMLIPRMVTAPLAVPIAVALGADVPMVATIVAVTGLLGANVARATLSAVRVEDPVTRGLAAGTSAHGLGTAAMADEPDAFPFAALAMALVGIFSTMLVTAPGTRAFLLRVALGKLSAGRVA